MKVWIVMVERWSDAGQKVTVEAVCASPELAQRRAAEVDARPRSTQEQRGAAWVVEPMELEEAVQQLPPLPAPVTQVPVDADGVARVPPDASRFVQVSFAPSDSERAAEDRAAKFVEPKGTDKRRRQ